MAPSCGLPFSVCTLILTTLFSYPIVYQNGKGWSAGSTGLMFIPLAIGVVMSAACAPLVNKHYLKVSAQYNGKPPAEKRLIPMMLSCWLIPIGLFIFAWTSYPRIHWFGPAIGGWPVGFGFIFLYNSANNYLGMWFPISHPKVSDTNVYCSGYISAPGSICPCSQDFPTIDLGCQCRSVH